jgi:hypothetical protein
MSVTSVFGRTGVVVAQSGDYSLSQLGDATITSPQTSQALLYNGSKWVNGRLVFSVDAFGAKGDNSTDDTAAIQSAINAAAATAGTAAGAWVEFHTGVYMITSRLTMPNCVSLRGQGRGTIIRAKGPYTDTRMIVASNGTTAMFNSRLVDLMLDYNDQNVANSAAIEAQAWQENCGLEHVVISKFVNYGVYLTHGYGGASYLKFRDIEIFASSYVAGTTGIRVDQISSVGAFVLDIEGASIVGESSSSIMTHAIDMANDSLIVKGLHVEYCTNAVHAGGDGQITMVGCTGSVGVSVVNLCKLETTFAAQICMIGCHLNGATNLIQNLVSGETIAADLPLYSYPKAYSVNTCKYWVTFSGSSGTVQESSGGVTVTRNGVGDYSITWPTAFADANYCYSLTHASGSISLYQEFSKSASVLRFRCFNWSGAAGAAAANTDPTQVYVMAFAVK